MALRAVFILGVVLLGCFVWRAWRPMPNFARLGAFVLAGAALLFLHTPQAIMTAVLLGVGAFWLIRRNQS